MEPASEPDIRGETDAVEVAIGDKTWVDKVAISDKTWVDKKEEDGQSTASLAIHCFSRSR